MNTALQPTEVAELSRSLFQPVIFEVTRNALHNLRRCKPDKAHFYQIIKSKARMDRVNLIFCQIFVRFGLPCISL